VNRIIDTLTNSLNSGSVKVRWNACYAVGNLFHSNYIKEILPFAPWSVGLFSSLLTVVKSCKNFKIRINAAISLSVLPERIHYGSCCVQVWQALIYALETIDDITDFGEFKYKDTLEHQLLDTLIHIIKLTTVDDFKQMKDWFLVKREFIWNSLMKYLSNKTEELQILFQILGVPNE